LFKEKYSFQFDLLSDSDFTVSKAFGAFSGDGKYCDRISVLINDEGFIKKIYQDVDPSSHPEQVLADLD